MNSTQLLQSGVEQLGIQVQEKQLIQLAKFIDLLQKWNEKFNLTTIVETELIIQKHILDSLTVLQHIHGNRVIDVGSGAGLPGIPLAVCSEDKQFVLLDAHVKKTVFIQQTAIELGLKNVQVVHERIENYMPEPLFDCVISRATMHREKIIQTCNHLLSSGRIIIMLGKESELSNLPAGYILAEMKTVEIPGLQSSRHLALVDKQN